MTNKLLKYLIVDTKISYQSIYERANATGASDQYSWKHNFRIESKRKRSNS